MIGFPAQRAAGLSGAWRLLIVMAALSLIAGCGDDGLDTVPLAGKVTLNGQPLEGADITFFNDEYETGMITLPGGIYSIPTGAMPGDYQVTISKIEGGVKEEPGVAVGGPQPGAAGRQLLPAQFSSRTETVLKITVPPEGTDAANFDLKTE